MTNEGQRRYVILAEGKFGDPSSKTAMGVIAYGRDDVVAVLDSTQAGSNVSAWLPAHDIPIVASLGAALPRAPTALLLGIAPAGGKIPALWRTIIGEAIGHGLDIVSGLHELVSQDPEFEAAASAAGVDLVDYRVPPERHEVASGRRHRDGAHVVLTVGTDCAVGKMTVALELRRAAVKAGVSTTFVPTGQTGMMIEGWGVPVDAVVSDFLSGTCEWLVEEAEDMGDWIFVEGQGSLDHPSYSSVTLGLVHGAAPDAMVLVHEVGRTVHHGWEGSDSMAATIKPLAENIALYETVAAAVASSTVAAIALNTRNLSEEDARTEIASVANATGLPTDDPVRFGPDGLFAALRQMLEVPAP